VQQLGDVAVQGGIPIGSGTRHDMDRPGNLYGFANDAWGFSRNNSGTVRLTVARG
jgi:hypothetical protein